MNETLSPQFVLKGVNVGLIEVILHLKEWDSHGDMEILWSQGVINENNHSNGLE